MKVIVVLALVALALAKPEDKYDSKYDNFDVDEVIDNMRLLKAYTLCFLGEGKCTPDGNTFKTWIPDAVQTDCGKCTEKQKVLIAKMMKATKEKLPEEWSRLNEQHNPDNKYSDQFDNFISKYSS